MGLIFLLGRETDRWNGGAARHPTQGQLKIFAYHSPDCTLDWPKRLWGLSNQQK